MFSLAPRCLSPLIYGLRDEKFVHALKCYASFGFLKRNIIKCKHIHLKKEKKCVQCHKNQKFHRACL